MTSTTTQISDGPNKYDLMLALFDGDSMKRRTVEFKIDSGKRMRGKPVYNVLEVVINLIAREDGSGECWLFEGYIVGVNRGNIHGFYSTKTRTGWYGRGAKYTLQGLTGDAVQL